MAPGVGNICREGKSQFLEVDVLEARKMGKCKDLCNFYKGQTVMARRLDQSSKSCGVFPVCSG